MKGILEVMFVCLGGALLGGCTDFVTITSEPPGARVRIDGEKRGRTPCTVLVEWWATEYNRITLEHPGCYPLSTVLRRTARVKYIILDVSFWPLLFLNSVGPIENQHFVLARRTARQETARPPARGADARIPAPRAPDVRAAPPK